MPSSVSSAAAQYAYQSKKTVQSKSVMTGFNSKESHEKLAIQIHVLQNTYGFVILRGCFAEDDKEVNKDSTRTCTAVVLFIKRFVKRRSRCLPLGLLKLSVGT